ncbi:MAG: NAD(P)-binding protein, partial [Calditrichae bacterium]|nr:NAD(P)-binding protein [Calditrichia bacterium]NIW80353.1 NAD(P)-binding protein [Calditrichia bacterium]
MKKEHITIIGAGLAGSLLAIYLAKKGFRVSVYERRPDMRRETISAGRSINLALSTRGIHALQEVGLADKIL